MSPRRPMWVLALALTLAVGPGCGGCGDEPPESPTPSEAPTAATGAPAPTPAARALEAAPSDTPPRGSSGEAHPLAKGWQRAVPAEPSAAARGLYRRAVERVHAGAPDEATPLFARIRADFGDSRFATRLKGGGDPAATAALLGLAATVGAAAFSGALRSIQRPVKPAAP